MKFRTFCSLFHSYTMFLYRFDVFLNPQETGFSALTKFLFSVFILNLKTNIYNKNFRHEFLEEQVLKTFFKKRNYFFMSQQLVKVNDKVMLTNFEKLIELVN